MCGAPIALVALSTAASMAGTYMQYQQQSKAAQNQADYQAQVATNEITQQNQQTQSELARGVTERDSFLRSGNISMGGLRSQLAAGNFTLDSGSNRSLLSQEAEGIQHQAQLISQRSAEAAYAHQVGATQAYNRQGWAEYEKRKAGYGKDSLLVDMGGTLLGGLGRGLNK